MTQNWIERRTVLKLMGVGAFSNLAPFAQDALAKSKLMYASAYHSDSGYGIAILSEDGTEIFRLPLPNRGHDIVFSQDHKWGVVFARRPGNFALAFDPQNKRKPVSFQTPADRHFYGHGVFSADGKLLYATENDFENSTGVIGVYDVTENFERINEFWSGGTGPHDVLLLPDQQNLVVANGGIETHPDYGRSKLNVDTMVSSIVVLDTDEGVPKAVYKTAPEFYQVSLRHMAIDDQQTLWIAGQKQGQQLLLGEIPLIFRIKQAGAMEALLLPKDINESFQGYLGSIAALDNNQIAVSSPKGNIVTTFDSDDLSKVTTKHLAKASGLAKASKGIVISTENGLWCDDDKQVEFDGSWDNHIASY